MRYFAEVLSDPLTATALHDFLQEYNLTYRLHDDGQTIPDSYWGEPEAGIAGDVVHVRSDTPLHSFLHESCHLICAARQQRCSVRRDAGGSDAEEAAVCYLQLCIAEKLDARGWRGIAADMDAWGYSFPNASTAQWFESNASDARHWLLEHGLDQAVSGSSPL